jgi:glutamine amidotransferase
MGFVGILDLQCNNGKSILSMLKSLGINAELITSKNQIRASERLIIPGVGHIESIVREIDELGYRDAISDFSKTGNYLLGICLGQHLLGTGSEESPRAVTLGVLDFKVNRLPANLKLGLRVPHVGWNSVSPQSPHPLFHKIPPFSDFYFSHSYAITSLTESTIAFTEHSVEFTSVAGHDNIMSTQFHPEKSQKVGRQLLANFCALS